MFLELQLKDEEMLLLIVIKESRGVLINTIKESRDVLIVTIKEPGKVKYMEKVLPVTSEANSHAPSCTQNIINQSNYYFKKVLTLI